MLFGISLELKHTYTLEKIKNIKINELLYIILQIIINQYLSLANYLYHMLV